MILRGLDMPRRIGTERFDMFDGGQSSALKREFDAIDTNLREVLSRIEVLGGRLSPYGRWVDLPLDINLPHIVEALPDLPDPLYPPGALAVLTSNWKLYRNEADVWTAAVAAVDLTGTITETQIADDSISTPKLQALAVTTVKLDALAVTAAKLAADSVETAKLAAGAVTAAKISVASLSAISASMGTLTAGKIDVGNIEINADTEQILFGSATAPGTGTGIFMGLSGGLYQFRVGNPSGDYILWNGSTLTINGQTFTHATPVFDGRLEIRSASGARRFYFDTTSGHAAFSLYDTNDAIAATLIATDASVQLIAAGTRNLILDTTGGGETILDRVARIGFTDGATIQNVLTGSVAWNPGSIASGTAATTTLTVTGAAVGDWVVALDDYQQDNTNLKLAARVSAADTVTLYLHNTITGGGSIDPPSRTIRVVVMKF